VLHLKGPLKDLDDSGPTPYRVGEGTGGHHDNGEQGEVPALEVAERRGARRLAKIWTRWRTQRPERHAGGMSQYNVPFRSAMVRATKGVFQFPPLRFRNPNDLPRRVRQGAAELRHP